jgi:hypothetical protein
VVLDDAKPRTSLNSPLGLMVVTPHDVTFMPFLHHLPIYPQILCQSPDPCCMHPFVPQMGYYDRSRDISLLRAVRQCSAREKQYNATLCQSTVLTAY